MELFAEIFAYAIQTYGAVAAILLCGLGIILVAIYYFSKRTDIVVDDEKIDLYSYGNGGDFKNKKYYSYDEVPLFRDLPFKDDFFSACYVASQYGIGIANKNVIKFIFLKWIKDGNIRVIKKEDCELINEIILDKAPEDSNEMKLYFMLDHAAKDGVLITEEFKYYCEDNHQRICNELSNIIVKKYGEVLENPEYITINYNKENKLHPYYEFVATDKLNEKALQLAGLKKFFHELTLIHEKEPIEVKLWREYLIYAQIFNQAKKVSKIFNEFYNINVIEFNDFDLLGNFLDSTLFSAITSEELYKAADNLISTHIVGLADSYINPSTKAHDYSGGGGGFSSFGGGGGSFGGGGGGGGFR